MTATERKALGHLIATEYKATVVESSDEPALWKLRGRKFLRMLSDDPKVLSLTKDRYERFQLTTAARILRDSADKLSFNRCPRCGKLARTPTAKQCRYCKHDWH
jgi:hypothetical protein